MDKKQHLLNLAIIIAIVFNFILDANCKFYNNINTNVPKVEISTDEADTINKIVKEKTFINGENPLNCPFCGAKAELKKWEDTAWISCTNNECKMGTDHYRYTNLEDAVKKAISVWNYRIG